MAVGSPELIKTLNQRIVLQAIRGAGLVSRADLAAHTSLTRPTVSAIVSDLLASGWAEEVGEGASSGGRRPIMLRFNPRCRWVVGAELGAGHVRAVLVDLDGSVHRRARYRVEGYGVAENLELVKSAVREVLQRAGDTQVVGIGVGLTGLVDGAAGQWHYSPHFRVRDVPVADLLQQTFALPVALENDARAMALGEHAFGAARGADDVVALRVGVGIGAGLILGGVPYAGAYRGAGEIGHTTIDADGPRCSCGNYGCLEAVAAAPAIARRAVKRIRQGQPSLIPELVDGDLELVHGRIVIEAALQGDALGREVLRDTGRYLGMAAANLINVLGPALVVLGGGVARAGGLLLEPVREVATARVLPGLRDQVNIVLGQLGEEAGAVGAAAQVAAGLFSLPALGVR